MDIATGWRYRSGTLVSGTGRNNTRTRVGREGGATTRDGDADREGRAGNSKY